LEKRVVDCIGSKTARKCENGSTRIESKLLAAEMLAHTFRGCSLASILGLKDERAAFQRQKATRRVERKNV
jgi:hypothetical protein